MRPANGNEATMPARKSRQKAPRPGKRSRPVREARRAGAVIVGLGASAGGLAALEQFFRNVPPGLGAAFVVVQHLDPEHASVLVELLQRVTSLPVVEVTDGMEVRADTVHVIPPNREMEVFDGTLLLTVPSAPRGKRMAVDGFFRSLAGERGSDAVGVVLSGTGSDGALGLRAIRDAGGLCFAQAPATARFEGMPAAAIAAVAESKVAPAEQLPALLASALGTLAARPRRPPPSRAVSAGLGRVLAFLRSATGRDFSQYKRSSVVRRVERRMAANGVEDVEVYARHLREHPAEVKTLFQELLINVTSFFRDPEAFEALQSQVLRRIVDAKEEGEDLRVWVGGCATGEEAYSIAILLRELMEQSRREVKVQIYGTDLDESAISAARAGVYPLTVAADISPERLKRHFIREEAGYRVRKEIRDQVVFAVQDLIKDPPFTRLDLISCRNVFIYMEAGLQERILTLFHYALRPGGVLFLSPAEGIGDHARLFTPIDRKWRLFRAQRNAASARAVLTSGLSWVRSAAGGDAVGQPPPSDFADVTRRVLPPLKAARGKGGARTTDSRRIQELTRALTDTRESLQATIEEQQTSHEELQSTNEEVQASNEELETANEELLSVNEELTTVNAELQAKVEQLSGMQDDMRNLLDVLTFTDITKRVEAEAAALSMRELVERP